MRHMFGGDYYFGPREIHKGFSMIPLLEMEAHPLKNFEKAEIRL